MPAKLKIFKKYGTGNVTGNATGISVKMFALALAQIELSWTNQPLLKTLQSA